MGYELNPFTRKLDKVGAAGTGGGAVSVNFSAGSTSANLSAVTFANANNVTFGLNAGTITASVIPGAAGGIAASLSGNTAGALANISTGTMYLAGGNNITLSQNANSVTISGPNTVAQTQFVLSNSNGVSFGTNGSTVTASHNGITSQSVQTQGVQGASAGTTQMTSGTINFLNSGGISWGLNGTNLTGVVGAVRNVSANGSSMSDIKTLQFDNSNGITVGLSTGAGIGTITLSHNGLTTAMASNRGTDFVQATAAFNGTNASGTIASNAISVSVSPQSVQTQNMVSINGSTGAISLATGSSLSSSSNGSTITFGLASNITTALQSAGAYLTTAALSNHSHGFSASGGSSAFQTLNFANSNGITFSNSNGSVIASHNGLTTARASTDAIGLNTAQSNVTWTANSSGLSLDARGYAGTNTATTGSISVTLNSSGISLNAPAFLTTAMASNRGSDFVQANAAFAGTNASGTIASNGISVSVNAGGGATPVASASNGSFSFTTLGFSNANNVTFGTSAGSIVTASVAAPGAAAENNWFALTGANTAGNTTASGSTIGLSGINLTLSGTNGSGINISAPATSSLSATGQVSISTNGSTISIGVPNAVTYSRYNEFKESPMVAGQQGQGTLHIQPWLIPNLHMDRVVQHVQFTNASNSSNSFTVSNWVGIYTKNASTLSLLHSISTSTNFTASGTAGSYSLWGGVGYRGLTAGLTQTLTEGMYWIGVLSRTTTGGGAGMTLNQMLNSNVNSTYSGLMGVATNATNQISLGMGVYSATTSAMPGSIAFTQINGMSSVFLRPPSIYFVSGTI